MLMTLCETGTRGLITAAFGPTAAGELAYAHRLVPRLGDDMLLLGDRAFDSNGLLEEVAAQGAQFLVRCKSSRRFPVLTLLPDGSYLTRIGHLDLRVIEATVRARTADGSRIGDTYRLLTTLTDHRTDPAFRLVHLYHERWEVESAYLALRHTLLKGRVLRSKDPVGVTQEMWGLLTLYQALRSAMVTAVETRPGCDPDRAGFSVALEAARDTVVRAAGTVPATLLDGGLDLVGHIGTAVLHALLPARRPRLSTRIVKCGISRYHTWNRDDRPLASTPITKIDIEVQSPAPPSPRAPTTPSASGRGGRWDMVSRIFAADPDRPRTAKEIATALGISGSKPFNSISTQLGLWSRRGLLHRTAPSTYKLVLPTNWTPTPST